MCKGVLELPSHHQESLALQGGDELVVVGAEWYVDET